MTRGVRIVVAVLATLILFQVFKALMADGPAGFASIASGILVWLVLPKRADAVVAIQEEPNEETDE